VGPVNIFELLAGMKLIAFWAVVIAIIRALGGS
jgi:hypothetical protein